MDSMRKGVLPVAQRHAENLVAMRGYFAPPFTQVPDDMYSKVVRGTAVRDRSSVVVNQHALVSTNTYWGRFPASYWQRWTRVTEVDVDAVVTGAGVVSVKASDYDGWPRTVHCEPIAHAQDQRLSFTIPLDSSPMAARCGWRSPPTRAP